MTEDTYYNALGFLYGDGYLSPGAVRIDLTITDWWFLKDLQTVFGGTITLDSRLDTRTGKMYHRARYYTKCAALHNDLKYLRTASDLGLPNLTTILPLPYMPAFISGLINADGSLFRKRSGFNFYLCLEPGVSYTIQDWLESALDVVSYPRERRFLRDLRVYKQSDINKIYDMLIRPYPKIIRKIFLFEFYKRQQASGRL